MAASRRKVFFVFPTAWDARQLERCRESWAERFEVEFGTITDWDCRWDLDVLAYIDQMSDALRGRIDGVASSSDYPGATVAGAIATRLGLPGTDPATLVACAHKYAARQVLHEVVPEATPNFALLDGDTEHDGSCPIGFPCFVKPVKGAFSVLARRMQSAEQLHHFVNSEAAREFCESYLHIFDTMMRRFTDLPHAGRYFLAESVLVGSQVTVEGWCMGDEVQILGISDSVVDPITGSFLRFVFPSALDARVQERMGDIAARAVRGLGLRDTFFSIEMMYDTTRDHIGLIEVNPRICGEFGDLYQKVLGVNSYELALELATGGRPRLPRAAGAYAVAASFPLRVFKPVRVQRVPAPEDMGAAEALFPGTMIWNECEAGQELADFDRTEDGASCRYAVINLGAPDRSSLDPRFEAVRESLPYRFTPL